jgi:hypothetical protein
MSTKDISNNILIEKNKIDRLKMIRRNAIANLELTESYKEFIKYYKETNKEMNKEKEPNNV